jgi:nitrate/nitrite transporter NarK
VGDAAGAGRRLRLSQAFRTVAAIMAPPLQQEFGFTPQQLGLFAGAFHLAFGALQLFMGMGIDVWGPRRTVLVAFPLAVVGALVAATAHGHAQLLVAPGGHRHRLRAGVPGLHGVHRAALPGRALRRVNGMAMGIGSVGLLLTGTPLAWVIERILARRLPGRWPPARRWPGWHPAAGARSNRRPAAAPARPDVLQALRGYGELFSLPHTWGIVVLASFTYASFLALRGLWLGPLLVDRHGFTLVQAGNVALAISVLGMLGPPLFGRLDPGDRTGAAGSSGFTLLAAVFAVIAASRSAWLDVAVSIGMSLVSGYIVLQYADVRSSPIRRR